MQPEVTATPRGVGDGLLEAATLVVGGRSFSLDEEAAVWVAECLRWRFASWADAPGRALAARIELVLVGEVDGPVEVSREEVDDLYELLRGPQIKGHDGLLAVRAAVWHELGFDT